MGANNQKGTATIKLPEKPKAPLPGQPLSQQDQNVNILLNLQKASGKQVTGKDVMAILGKKQRGNEYAYVIKRLKKDF